LLRQIRSGIAAVDFRRKKFTTRAFASGVGGGKHGFRGGITPKCLAESLVALTVDFGVRYEEATFAHGNAPLGFSFCGVQIRKLAAVDREGASIIGLEELDRHDGSFYLAFFRSGFGSKSWMEGT
jgi:hypothetical protein